MIRMCQQKGCDHPAAWSFKLCVPAEGHSPTSFAPLVAMVGVVLCPRHIEETNPGEWLDANEGSIRNTFVKMASGRARPDFRRSYIQRISINSPEFANFEREAGQGSH